VQIADEVLANGAYHRLHIMTWWEGEKESRRRSGGIITLNEEEFAFVKASIGYFAGDQNFVIEWVIAGARKGNEAS
jgi:hypothetical protein